MDGKKMKTVGKAALVIDHSSESLDTLLSALAPERERLMAHPVFQGVTSLSDLQAFMESHVFAVWDFMTLLKSLQQKLTCTDVPWHPMPNPLAARFVNEIVLGEESDEVMPGEYVSHYDLYVAAMREVGCRTNRVDVFIDQIRLGIEPRVALLSAPDHVREFVMKTIEFTKLEPHQALSAFLFGREDIIPQMFQNFLDQSKMFENVSTNRLKLYLKRHIEIDGDSHAPLALRILSSLSETSNLPTDKFWSDVEHTAREAIAARIRLWDGVQQEIENTKLVSKLKGAS
jgi:hypothetical protein